MASNVALPGLSATAGVAPDRLLAISVETTGTRACLVEPVAGRHRLIGWVNLARSRDATMTAQVAETCRRLGQRLGCVLWDEELNAPYSRSVTPIHFPPVQHVGVTLSARPPLRVLLAGLSSGQSMAAARVALSASPCLITAELAWQSGVDSALAATLVNSAQPDVIVLVGGFDQQEPASHAPLFGLCKVVGAALGRLPRTQRPPVIFAGNHHATDRAELLLRSNDGPLPLEVVGNVLPAPDDVRTGNLARELTYAYWRLNQRISGFRELAHWTTSPGQATTVEASFVQLVQAWMLQMNLTQLHAAYCGQQWRVHVWVSRSRTGAWLRFVEPLAPLPDMDLWPPLQLLSGDWPNVLPLPSQVPWWDRNGLAPAISALGQVTPQAMFDVLEADLFADSV